MSPSKSEKVVVTFLTELLHRTPPPARKKSEEVTSHPLTLDICAAVDTYLNVDNDVTDDVEKLKTTFDDPQTLSNISLTDLVNFLILVNRGRS